MSKVLKVLFLLVLFWAKPICAADEDNLRQIYTLIPEHAFEKITQETVAVSLLKGISSVDENLRVGNDVDRLSLYYKGKLLKSFYKPRDRQDIEAWVKLSAELLDLAVEYSPKAAQHDFELADLAMVAASENLSHSVKFYLSSETKDSKRLKHHRFFAARKEGESLYLRLTAFNASTIDDIKQAAEQYPDSQGVILDLRGNPGGSFDAAIKVVDLFLDDAIITSTRGRKPEDSVYYNAEAGDFFEGKPLVVLIDGETASAAEIVAAALQEQGRAKLIGTRTFGKASVQQLLDLPSGAVLSVTKAYYYTPSGFLIEKSGVFPDICTFEMPETKDVHNLLSAGVSESCLQESRSEEGLDLDAAKEWIEQQIQQKM